MYRTFMEMPVWQKAMDVGERVFRLSQHFPKSELFGLISQIRRSANGIGANVAEGFGRNHTNDKIRFYHYARGSAMETRSHVEYALRIGYLDEASAIELGQMLSEVISDLNKLVKTLEKSQ